MSTVPGELHQQARERHQRESLLTILLPAAVGAVALVLLLILVMAISTRGQVSIVADLLLTIVIVCPLAVCAFPVAIGLVVTAVLMGRAHRWTDARIGGLIRISTDLGGTINKRMDNLARFAIKFGVFFAPIEKLVLSAFDEPEQKVKGSNEPDHTQRP